MVAQRQRPGDSNEDGLPAIRRGGSDRLYQQVGCRAAQIQRSALQGSRPSLSENSGLFPVCRTRHQDSPTPGSRPPDHAGNQRRACRTHSQRTSHHTRGRGALRPGFSQPTWHRCLLSLLDERYRRSRGARIGQSRSQLDGLVNPDELLLERDHDTGSASWTMSPRAIANDRSTVRSAMRSLPGMPAGSRALLDQTDQLDQRDRGLSAVCAMPSSRRGPFDLSLDNPIKPPQTRQTAITVTDQWPLN